MSSMDLHRYIRGHTRVCCVILLLFIAVVGDIPWARGGVGDPYHTKEEKIEMWKTLWDSHPGTDYESVGKTYEGRDIWLFKAGNPRGGRVLWDAEMHGGEDSGGEILYMIAEWLLESGDSTAKKILASNYVLFIPILNVDSTTRLNKNYDNCFLGVDLNRNFETGWRFIACDSDTLACSGPYPLSEPETRVLVDVFDTYRPDFYVNLHGGAGPVLLYSNIGDVSFAHEVIETISKTSSKMGVTPYRTSSMSPGGMSIGDASLYGVSSWLIEVVDSDMCWTRTEENYRLLEDVYFPKNLAIFIAMCESCEYTDSSAVFEDGFESGGFSNWAGTSVSVGDSASVASVLPHHGVYHGSFTSNGGDSWESAYSYTDIDEDEVYARGYFYVDEGMPLVDDNDRFYFLRFRAEGMSLTGAGIRRDGGVDKWILYGKDGEAGVGPVYASAVEMGRWYCVELHWEKGSDDGLVELYVDGEKVLEMGDIDTSYYGNVDEIDFGLISATHLHNSVVIYGDCLVVSDEYIGSE